MIGTKEWCFMFYYKSSLSENLISNSLVSGVAMWRCDRRNCESLFSLKNKNLKRSSISAMYPETLLKI